MGKFSIKHYKHTEKDEITKDEIRNKLSDKAKFQATTIAILLIAVLLLILFPISLNAIITNQWYLEYPINSDLAPTDWFAFAGSYIGALGTVICGWVAYRQNSMMAKQQQILDEQHSQMQELQGLLAKYQLALNPFFGALTFELYEECYNDFEQEEKKKNAYDLTYGQRMPDDLGSCIWLAIDIKITDIIPICDYQVQEITYAIDEQSYSLDIPKPGDDGNGDGFIPEYGEVGIQNNDSIRIMITEKNSLKDKKSIQALFDAVKIFSHWRSFPKAGYDNGEWSFRIFFKNQAGYCSTYLVSYHMHQADNTHGWQICQPRCRRMKDT